ncbi:MAG TPA: glycosyltransferase family 61 protein, partial [Pseudomonadales bacterium]|nr:glycosyltransferase family 61 protein [Pseudomonadales bacterium]
HGGSYAYLLKDAVLVDGMLFGPKGYGNHVLKQKRHSVMHALTREETPCALYSSLYGNIYWGHWLKDDCSTYLVAKDLAKPVSVQRTPFFSQPDYEALLGMDAEPKNATWFKELWVFDDFAQNESRRQRYMAMRNRILSSAGLENKAKHRGVYIARGHSGVRRLLVNEDEVIDFFRARDFAIVDTMNSSVADIVNACAGASIVAGVEGSSLSHGFMMLEEGDSMLVLNPPNRFNNIYKDVSDCKGLNYATVVGDLCGADFSVNLTELEQTLALLPSY